MCRKCFGFSFYNISRNYYRYSFTYYAELEVGDSSLNELYALTDSLAKQANNLRRDSMTDEEGYSSYP